MLALVSGALATLTLVATAPASSLARTAGAPNLAPMAVLPSDLHGAVVKRQGYVKNPYLKPYYEREFKSGAAIGNLRTLDLESDVGLAGSATAAMASVSAGRAFVSSKRGRAELAKEILGAAGKAAKNAKLTFGRVRSLGAGDQSFIAPMAITVLGVIRFPVAVAFFRVDRVVEVISIAGAPGGKLVVADVARVATAVAARMRSGLTPVNVSPPTVSGTPVVGQALTATTGTWTNEPVSYAFQWQRCDSAGANCAPIDGAATATYVTTTADVGFTLRVSVTATNGVATTQAVVSAQTAVVTQPPTP